MYVGRDFDSVDSNSGQIYGFDFVSVLTPGATILAAAAGLILETGDDDSPQSRLIGASQIAGTIVTQMVFFGTLPANQLDGNTYVFFAVANTSDDQTIIPWARIPVDISFGP